MQHKDANMIILSSDFKNLRLLEAKCYIQQEMLNTTTTSGAESGVALCRVM